MPTPLNLENRTALVTGAANGIGRAIALSLAQRHCHLALVDINETALQQTIEMLRSTGVRASCYRADLSDPEAIAALPRAVLADHPGVDVLVNNAGVAVAGQFEQVSDEDFEWLFGVNFRGMVRMTRAFLPLLKASDAAQIAYLSSIFGIIAPPSQTAYVASKFAIRGFAESLRHELAQTCVGVTVVHPGGVATQIANNARLPAGVTEEEAAPGRVAMNKLLRLPPATAGEIIVKGIEKRKARVLVGRDAMFGALLERLAPTGYWSLLSRMARND
jgi:short-subunit dehydrogenase